MEHDMQITGEKFIESLYLELVGRPPDIAGQQSHLRELLRHKSPSLTLRAFINSEEFRTLAAHRYATQDFPNDLSPANQIELDLSDEQRSALWSHVEGLWSSLGVEDPYWSVMTNDAFRLSKMGTDAALKPFYETGRREVHRLNSWLERNGIRLDGSSVCAEYGCGVGRVTYWLSELFSRMVAFDISQPHLDAAQKWLGKHGRNNVRYQKVSGKPDLASLQRCDFFYSVIVLQHNPPPIMQEILNQALAGLNSGGHAFFQIPTYFRDYNFAFKRYLEEPPPDNKVEMHCLPQREIFRLARDNGCDVLEVQPDLMTGSPTVFTSNTFLLKKR
jgi:SAM-dependent methyltransferase